MDELLVGHQIKYDLLFFSLLRFLTCYGNVLKSFKLQNSKTKLYYGMMFRLKNARC